ncbi:tetratricopeptide repeat protein 9C-like [Dermacentor andersoni]|uniref:tetratricopeptide repeat protein 9C-like n=1 Tax=Dermacentor andersoni TaxID=34620 RepID=UPI0021555DC6|nr:tetratricopeptide repeat protein 9C-like [Dermacentor andersoni]
MAETELLTPMVTEKIDEMPASTEDSAKRRLTIPENLDHANACKLAGNDLYKEDKIKPAIRKYHECLLYLRACQVRSDMPITRAASPTLDQSTKEMVEKLHAECYNNLAACLLQLPTTDYNRVVQYCNIVLTMQPNNAKAIFRKGVACYKMGNYSLALQYLNDASRLRKGKPDDSIVKYIKLCTEAQSSSSKE